MSSNENGPAVSGGKKEKVVRQRKPSLRVAVKYLVRERDEALAKKAAAGEYARKLEQRVKQLEGDLKGANKQIAAFIKDYKQTSWYTAMQAKMERLERQNKDLWRQLNKQLVEERSHDN